MPHALPLKNTPLLLLGPPPPHPPDHCFSNIGTVGLLPIYSVNSIEPSLGNTTSKVKCYQIWKLFDPVIISTNANAGTKIACRCWFWDGHWWPRIGVYCSFYFEWNHSCYNVNNECSHPQEYACGPPWCKSRIQMISSLPNKVFWFPQFKGSSIRLEGQHLGI